MPKMVNESPSLTPYWQTAGRETVKLYLGDVLETLKMLPSMSVQCCITSPPYFSLRDYQTAIWDGGDVTCNHIERTAEDCHRSSTLGSKGIGHPVTNAAYQSQVKQFRHVCGVCGARRIDNQIGLESSHDCSGWATDIPCGVCYICKLVMVFSEVKRVLRDDGTLFLNLGDSYGSGGQLLGVPWRCALALQANGWILRSDMPWVRRNSMPESVTNRPCKSLEYVFMFAKKSGYYFDMEVIKKKFADARMGNPNGGGQYAKNCQFIGGNTNQQAGLQKGVWNEDGSHTGRSFRNSDLWFSSIKEPHGITGIGDEIVGLDVTSEPLDRDLLEDSHFATYPSKLIEPFILAGTSQKGCCDKCGDPWVRVVETKGGSLTNSNMYDRSLPRNRNGLSGSTLGDPSSKSTIGWQPSCSCNSEMTRPCLILDPFAGTCTTGAVAVRHGRRFIGIDLNAKYLDMGKRRVSNSEGSGAIKDMKRQMKMAQRRKK